MRKLLLLFAVLALAAAAQEPPATEKLAPYYPTPPLVVERMLRLANLQPGEKMYDLGSGDGRIVIMAARKFKADATGIEYDDDLYAESSAAIRKLKLEKTARIVHGDILKQDLSRADVVTVYLLPASNKKIQPMLEKQLRKGTRVVAHDFDFPDWKPDKIETVEDDGEGRSHTLFLYLR
jgi:protein-L-isoaspartate O-methyltransferase